MPILRGLLSGAPAATSCSLTTRWRCRGSPRPPRPSGKPTQARPASYCAWRKDSRSVLAGGCWSSRSRTRCRSPASSGFVMQRSMPQREPCARIACMPTFTTLLYDVRDAKAYITLNRPDRLNAIDDVMPGEIRAAVEQANADDDVRVIVVAGAGRAFCAGYDLKQFAESDVGDRWFNTTPWDPVRDYRE